MSIVKKTSQDSLPLPWNQQSIQIEISLSDIANKLASAISPDFPHKDLLVDRIMGRMDRNDKGGLSTLYNSLSGFTGEIDFKVGQFVCPKDLKSYSYVKNKNGEYKQEYVKIEKAVIEAIDLYRNDKLLISYSVLNSEGETVVQDRYIRHTEVILIDGLQLIEEESNMTA